ncbi:MAG TPA: hypothetical protein EYP43_00485, partial [Thermoplasmata archaeon]|nr:hypothetical protein [Thermoplasmata archaeon]
MRSPVFVLFVLCVMFTLVPMSADAFEAEITVQNAAAPGIAAVRPNGTLNVSILLHDDGTPLGDTEADLYFDFPTPGVTPGSTGFMTDGHGWYNTTFSLSLVMGGPLIISVCDPLLADGW